MLSIIAFTSIPSLGSKHGKALRVLDLNYLVVKITGKAFDAGSTLIKKYVSVLRSLLDSYRAIVITGGGSTARKYMDIARDIGVKSNYWLDSIGIWTSRLNSLLLISALSEYAYPRPPENLEEALRAVGCHKLVVMGGLMAGQSTASVLLQVAEALEVKRVYYFSAVGRVYDKDPAKYPDAKPFSVITASELKSILEQSNLPGEYALIDSKALDIALRSAIQIQLLDYKDPHQIEAALQGSNPGTIIIPK